MDLKVLFEKLKPKAGAGVNVSTLKMGIKPVVAVVVAVVLVLDIYVLQGAVRKVIASRSEEVGARQIASIRVDFEGYNKATTRINNSEVYTPKIQIGRNPFDSEEYLLDTYEPPSVDEQNTSELTNTQSQKSGE